MAKARIVVSNATPLINFSTIDALDILEKLFGEIVISGAVYNEVIVRAKQTDARKRLRRASWLSHTIVESTPLRELLRLHLDLGEAESISLAVEQRARLILLD